MTKQCILHVGFHKTASTTIQTTLRKNRRSLLKRGYVYPRFKTIFNLELINQGQVIFNLFVKRARLFPKQYQYFFSGDKLKQKFLLALERHLSSGKNIILSGENIATLNVASLIELKQFIMKHGYTIKVIAFVREPGSFCHSCVQQKVKMSRSIDQVNLLNLATYASKRIKKLQQIFSNDCEFYSFDQVKKASGGIATFFLKRVGIESSGFRSLNQHNNRTASNQSIRLISYINKVSTANLFNTINIVRRPKDTALLLNIIGAPFKLSKQELQSAEESLEQERESIFALIGLCFSSSSPGSEECQHWNKDAIDSLIRLLPRLDKKTSLCIQDYFDQEHFHNRVSKEDVVTIRKVISKRKFAIRQFKLVYTLLFIRNHLRSWVR